MLSTPSPHFSHLSIYGNLNNPVTPIDAGGGRDTTVTEWPIPIATKDGLAVFYWGGMPGDVGISRVDIPRELLEKWGDGDIQQHGTTTGLVFQRDNSEAPLEARSS